MLKSKKGFTVIEFAAVILALGVLMIIAKPNFMRNIEKTKLTSIIYDIKVAEKYVEELIITDRMTANWKPLSSFDLESEIKKGNVYELSGLAYSIEISKYQKISKRSFKSNLKGDFYVNLEGKIYYVDK